VQTIKERHALGQPILVGTRSVERNEFVGKLLEREGIPHNILNAKYHEKEGEIIAQAGKFGAVTIATNMAGRGVDIILGGNPPDSQEAQKVKDAGGLFVIGTERHEARRIDNQLQGRSGRQGDPGCTQFFVSLEDELLRVFGSDRIKSLMTALKIPEDQPIQAGMVSGAIESAQSKIEGFNFDIRKNVLDYDDVMNKHREVIYKKRKDILEKPEEELKNYMLEITEKAGYTKDDYEKKEKEIGSENMRKAEKIIALRTLDMLWMEHLEEMESVRDSVRLRAYGQQDPLVEYKGEAHRAFQKLLETIENNIANTILKVTITAEQRPANAIEKQNAGNVSSASADKNQVGRNDPCPCGSGKKYKKCCGK
jgi:preprotein translocase subunit SecA